MTCVQKEEATLTFAELADLIVPEEVTSVTLEHVEIHGDDEDADAFLLAKALRGHPSLERVRLTDVTFIIDGNKANEQMATNIMDGLVEMMLVSCGKLHTLQLIDTNVHAKSLGAIQYNESLQTLHVANYLVVGDDERADMQMLADAAAQCATLETIHVPVGHVGFFEAAFQEGKGKTVVGV